MEWPAFNFKNLIVLFCLSLGLVSCSNQEPAPQNAGPIKADCTMESTYSSAIFFLKNANLSELSQIIKKAWTEDEPKSGILTDFIGTFIRISRGTNLNLSHFLTELEKIPWDNLKPFLKESVRYLSGKTKLITSDKDQCAPNPNLYSAANLGKMLSTCSSDGKGGKAFAEVLYLLFSSNQLDKIINDFSLIFGSISIKDYITEKGIEKEDLRGLLRTVIPLLKEEDLNFAELKNLILAFLDLGSNFKVEVLTQKLKKNLELLLDDVEIFLKENPKALKNIGILIGCFESLDSKSCIVDDFKTATCTQKACYYRQSINSTSDFVYDFIHLEGDSLDKLFKHIAAIIKNKFLRQEATQLFAYFSRNLQGNADFFMLGKFLGKLLNTEPKARVLFKTVAQMEGQGIFNDFIHLRSKWREMRARCLK